MPRWLPPPSSNKTKQAIVLHGASPFCGPGAEVAALITEHLFLDLAAPVVRIGAENLPVPFAKEFDPIRRSLVIDAVRLLTKSEGPT